MQKKAIYQKFIGLFSHSTILITSLFILIANSPGNVWGADVYIDPTYSGIELGTFDKPYNRWDDIVSFSASNDYRQKCETTYSGKLTINTAGASGNHIIIGAYYDNAGSPVHEDGSPNFGRFCGNNAQKPIIKNTFGSGSLFSTDSAAVNQYLEINSVQFTDAETAIYINSNRNEIRYCYFYNLYWGIRVGLANGGDYTIIEYNYMDLNHPKDEVEVQQDPIRLYPKASNNTVQYNHITSYDHGGINIYGSDKNIVQYNYIFGDNGYEDYCIGHNANANNNITRYNYCKDAGQGLQFLSGNDNEIYYNVFTCNGSGQPEADTSCAQFQSQKAGSYDSLNNKFYNNLIYDNDNHTGQIGIFFYSGPDHAAEVYGNEIYNNIVLKVGGYCLRIVDTGDVIGTNYFKNNSCYDFGTNKYAMIKGSAYSTASSFNKMAYAANNRDDDPGLKNPSAGQFWPDSASDNVVGSGKDLGSDYNQILDPNATNFTALPPKVKKKTQPISWITGPYALPGGSSLVPPPKELKITPIP